MARGKGPAGRDLTSTTFAVLGLLAIRPWTTYELARQMDRTFSRFWPRARSKLYEEPKKLVAHGLARAEPDAVGRRPRTVYRITPAGRRALARWLGQPGEGPVLEFEQLLKLFFSEHGTRADALATLASARAWAEVRIEENDEVVTAYAAGEGAFPERLTQTVIVGRFISELTELVARWADWATGVVERWPEDPREAPPDWEMLEEMASVARQRMAARAEEAQRRLRTQA